MVEICSIFLSIDKKQSEISNRVRISSGHKPNTLEKLSPFVATEGIKYSGSKLKLLPYILSIVESLPVHRIFDGFSGTTRVSQAFAKCGYQVVTNDLAIWSKVFGECYLKGKKNNQLQEKIDYLNNLLSSS